MPARRDRAIQAALIGGAAMIIAALIGLLVNIANSGDENVNNCHGSTCINGNGNGNKSR